MPSQVTQVGRRCDVRVLTWNLAFSSPSRAALQGNYLRTLEPDLVCLQELNPASAESVRQHAELKWLSYQLDTSEASGSGRRRLANRASRRYAADTSLAAAGTGARSAGGDSWDRNACD